MSVRGATVESTTVERVTVEGGDAPVNISEFITSLNPTHRYRLNDSAFPAVDTGTPGGLDMDAQVGSPLTYGLQGPDDSTLSVDGASSLDFIRSATLTEFSQAATGTVLGFVRNLNNSVTALCQSNFTDERLNFAFGNNPMGVGTAFRCSMTMTGNTIGDRRTWEGAIDLTGWNTDNTWHLIGFVETGSAKRINVDGVEDTVAEIAVGASPPGSRAWFTNARDANSGAVLFNQRYFTASSNNVGQQSEWCVFDDIIITPAQFAELFAFITN